MHPGFKMKVIALLEDFAIDFDGRYSTLHARDVEQAINIVAKHNGEEVGLKSTIEGKIVTTERNYAVIKEDSERIGQTVPKEEVKFFQIAEDGSENEVEKFEKTKVLEIIKMIPESEWDSFLFEAQLELWPETEIKKGKSVKRIKPVAAFRFAQSCIEKGMLPVAKFSHGNGFKEFWAIIKPVMKDDKFGFRVGLARKRIELSHLVDEPSSREEVSVEESKTVSALGEI